MTPLTISAVRIRMSLIRSSSVGMGFTFMVMVGSLSLYPNTMPMPSRPPRGHRAERETAWIGVQDGTNGLSAS